MTEYTKAPADALDIASLWLKNGVGDPLTEERVHSIPIGKPRDFFRTHPDPGVPAASRDLRPQK